MPTGLGRAFHVIFQHGASRTIAHRPSRIGRRWHDGNRHSGPLEAGDRIPHGRYGAGTAQSALSRAFGYNGESPPRFRDTCRMRHASQKQNHAHRPQWVHPCTPRHSPHAKMGNGMTPWPGPARRAGGAPRPRPAGHETRHTPRGTRHRLARPRRTSRPATRDTRLSARVPSPRRSPHAP